MRNPRSYRLSTRALVGHFGVTSGAVFSGQCLGSQDCHEGADTVGEQHCDSLAAGVYGRGPETCF